MHNFWWKMNIQNFLWLADAVSWPQYQILKKMLFILLRLVILKLTYFISEYVMGVIYCIIYAHLYKILKSCFICHFRHLQDILSAGAWVCTAYEAKMGCALWLFSTRSTSKTLPLDRPPFMSSDLGVLSLYKTPNWAKSILAQKLVWPTMHS